MVDAVGHPEGEFILDGRVIQEEVLWWQPEERMRHQRPGPGILPPVQAEELHNSNHTLFSVNIIGSPAACPSDSLSAPSGDEIRRSIPHPNANFCPKDNGWVILYWKSSSVAPPPLARSYPETTLLAEWQSCRRQTVVSCIEDTGMPPPSRKFNWTHHFHKYERAVPVDNCNLTPRSVRINGKVGHRSVESAKSSSCWLNC